MELTKLSGILGDMLTLKEARQIANQAWVWVPYRARWELYTGLDTACMDLYTEGKQEWYAVPVVAPLPILENYTLLKPVKCTLTGRV